MMDNPYLEQIRLTLPRLLALFDADSTSRSYGAGDRYHWAWGLIDFGNGTFQGAAHGLARLWVSGMWPYATEQGAFLNRIAALFAAAQWLTRKDGSLEEAFPNEGSYCVTALVAFDLLCAIDLLRDGLAPPSMIARWQETVAPMIDYLVGADETHAFISNHLATAVAALARWDKLARHRGAEKKALDLLERILQHQSREGWFKEYEGADPGYQSLCTYYLADVRATRPDWRLDEPLLRSVRFLWNFAHPDGSFGGLYGSRCTRFYYPAGIQALADVSEEAAALASFLAQSVANHTVVALASMDEPNLVPMFNAYCWAAEYVSKKPPRQRLLSVPAQRREAYRLEFPEAGLVVDSGATHYTVISTHKGGIVYHFNDGQVAILDAGVVVSSPRGELGSSQNYSPENLVTMTAGEIFVQAKIAPMPKSLPTPQQFVVLRLLSISVFRFAPFREWAKKMLVRFLITRRNHWPATNTRRIRLGANLSVDDTITAPAGYKKVATTRSFVAIHMASQGYWQIQDEVLRS